MSTSSGSPGTPSRRRPSARGHSGSIPGTPSRRRRASARGRSGGRAQDSEARMEEEETVHAQVEKMERVAARAVDKAAVRAREAAARSLVKAAAYAKGAISGSLNESLLMPQSTCNTNLTPTPSSTPAPAIGSDMVAVTNPPIPKEEDETWNKRQIMYILVLTATVGVVFLMYPFLPPVCGRLILLLVAAVWGVAIVGLPYGLYGTSRCEKECSRHVGWLISTLFAVFMVYCFYVVAMRVNGTSAPAPSSSSLDGTDSSDDFWWTVAFGLVGFYVLAGYLWAWFRVK